MASDNIICTGLVQASNQNTPAVIRATQSGGVYTLVVSGAGAAITIDSQTTGNLVSWGAAGHIADSTVTVANTQTAIENVIAQDSGWVANADGGSTTAVIASQAVIEGIGTALDVAVPGAGALVVAMASKIKALETSLAQQLRPNA